MNRNYVVHVSEEAKREYEENERINPRARLRFCPECDMNMTATVPEIKETVGGNKPGKEKEGGK